MLNAVADILLYPITLVLEVLYLVFDRVSHSPGLAILGVGMAVNVLTLPLYAKAEAWQAVERAIRARLKPKIDDIKAVFKGDERMMILATYYRQNHYHPVYALRSSTGLLLQIPFFIAAYAFLSNLPRLSGQAFLFIPDLSKPDGLLGGMNLLPFLMTFLNILASAVYAKGLPLKEKIQLYGMAGLFLVLLYWSPSGLVLYWTFNNLFSLGKNVAFKLRRPALALYAVMASGALALSAAALFVLDTTARKRLLVLAASAVVLLSPVLAKAYRWTAARLARGALAQPATRRRLFLLSSLALTLMVGLVVPVSLVSSSPQEFSFLGGADHPLYYVLRATLQSLGFFLVWPALVYILFGKNVKSFLAAGMAVVAACVALNVFVFGGDYGTISRALVFPDEGLLKPPIRDAMLNLGAMGVAMLACVLVFSVRRVRVLTALMGIASVSLGAYGCVKAAGTHARFVELAQAREEAASVGSGGVEPVFRLSTSGKNVLVFMLDRAVSGIIPELVAREADVARALDGFTWYPNTLSFNAHTMPGAPPLFGGYDYTPHAMNQRHDQALVDKHNEALSVMPVLFARQGWSSTITDASWANYSWVPDNRIFERHEGVRAFNLEGAYTEIWLGERGLKVDPSGTLRKNLVRFALFKAMPMALRFGLYDGGAWWDSEWRSDSFADFVDKFAPLDYLPRLFAFVEDGNHFSLIVNNTTHEARFLGGPGYEPVPGEPEPSPRPYDDDEANKAYHVAAAALKRLGLLFESMKEAGAWDNTRVIIVADHGGSMRLPAFSSFKDGGGLAARFNPLLLAKDFGASGVLRVDQRFGTNGDVPAMATEGVTQMLNPFTGTELTLLEPGAAVDVLTRSIYDPSSQPRTTFDFSSGDFVSVQDNIFNPDNWKNHE